MNTNSYNRHMEKTSRLYNDLRSARLIIHESEQFTLKERTRRMRVDGHYHKLITSAQKDIKRIIDKLAKHGYPVGD